MLPDLVCTQKKKIAFKLKDSEVIVSRNWIQAVYSLLRKKQGKNFHHEGTQMKVSKRNDKLKTLKQRTIRKKDYITF